MPQSTIKLDEKAIAVIRERRRYAELYNNKVKDRVSKSFRNDLFNLKPYLTASRQKDSVLYLYVNLFTLIATSNADFVVADGVEVKIDDKTAQEKRNEIAEDNSFDELLYDSAIEQSWCGYTTFRVWRDDEKQVIIDQIPYDYYYPQLIDSFLWEDPDTIHIVSKILNPSDMSNQAKIQTYTKLQNKKRRLSYGLYEQGLAGSVTGEYSLKEQLATDQTLEFLNIYRIDNRKAPGQILGANDFEDIIDLIEEVSDRMTQISVQFIKHLNAKLSLPPSAGESVRHEKSRAKKQGLTRSLTDAEYFVHEKGENPAQYIENINSLIPEAQDHVERVLKLIGAISQLPLNFLWFEDKGGAEKVEALRIRMLRFLKKIQRKRRRYINTLKRLVKDSLALAGCKGDYEITIEFNDTSLTDFDAQSKTYMSLFNQNLLSAETTLEKIFDRENETVLKEMEKISMEKISKEQDEKFELEQKHLLANQKINAPDKSWGFGKNKSKATGNAKTTRKQK